MLYKIETLDRSVVTAPNGSNPRIDEGGSLVIDHGPIWAVFAPGTWKKLFTEPLQQAVNGNRWEVETDPYGGGVPWYTTPPMYQCRIEHGVAIFDYDSSHIALAFGQGAWRYAIQVSREGEPPVQIERPRT